RLLVGGRTDRRHQLLQRTEPIARRRKRLLRKNLLKGRVPARRLQGGARLRRQGGELIRGQNRVRGQRTLHLAGQRSRTARKRRLQVTPGCRQVVADHARQQLLHPTATGDRLVLALRLIELTLRRLDLLFQDLQLSDELHDRADIGDGNDGRRRVSGNATYG